MKAEKNSDTDKKEYFRALTTQLKSLTEDVPYLSANLSNASALLFHSLEHINWAGFYLMRDGKLVLGPFQGKPACVEIPVGRGVCGTAAQKDITLVVPDVHCFEGHIACDSASRSEIVVPIHGKDGRVAGVLDIDSPVADRFGQDEAEGLEMFVKVLEHRGFSV